MKTNLENFSSEMLTDIKRHLAQFSVLFKDLIYIKNMTPYGIWGKVFTFSNFLPHSNPDKPDPRLECFNFLLLELKSRVVKEVANYFYKTSVQLCSSIQFYRTYRFCKSKLSFKTLFTLVQEF